ncbi:hypothetical protein EJ08DRAFT_183733 [Tothia fuscella]|uniref:Uncharacterized protein n=1 Tax=Tothia fuscella TaxID=1048955 RepID=A0A9P4NTC0_9PEZI|nr:hypothetical protein EJ08DRAFT_183733 [Tothia fuscella]
MAPKQRSRPEENSTFLPRSRSSSPSRTCLRQSPKPKKKKLLRKKPALTQDDVQAQIAARIAQLTAPPAATSAAPSPKVKSNAVLNSTKIARLTTKIARNELEVARLEREYADAKAALEHEEKIQAATRLSMQLKERCDLLVKKVEKGEMTEAEVTKERDAIVAEMVPVSQVLTKLAKIPRVVAAVPAVQEFARMSLKEELD